MQIDKKLHLLPEGTCKLIVAEICREMESTEVASLVPSIRQMLIVMGIVPKLEKV